MSENIKYHHSTHITFECLTEMRDETQYDELTALTQMFFERKPNREYFDRLKHADNPLIIFAMFHDALIGCKIGYQCSSDSFYSWIGGVHPNFRRQGIAQNMLQLQIDWCTNNRFRIIRTKTLINNPAMYCLNFKNGFRVIGNEIGGKYGNSLLLSKTLPTIHTD